jgi:CheY-like chemotaxis protein
MLAPGRYVLFSVSDNGIGMDEAVRARIFEPFFTTKPVGKGTGLGLAVAHGIVQAHQGAITVESQLGVGTTFRIWLPLVDQPSVAAVPNTHRALKRQGNGERIALVDDDELMRLMIQRLLEFKGYIPLCFDSAAAALAALRADRQMADLLITDFNMPGVNGLELAQALAVLVPSLPVIISSGYIDDVLMNDAKAAGVRAVLHKEMLLDSLGPELQRALHAGQEAVAEMRSA